MPWSSVRWGRVTVVEVSRRMLLIDGYDRAFALAAHAFSSLVPVLVVLDVLLPDSHRAAARKALAPTIGLSESTEQALGGLLPGDLTDAAPVSHGLTIVGTLLMVVALYGYDRALQRTHRAVWGLPSRGARDWGTCGLAVLVLLIELGVLGWIGVYVVIADDRPVVAFLGHAVVATLIWWSQASLLLSGQVRRRALLPGAAFTGIAQAAIVAVSSTYLPFSVTGQAARNGVVGAAIAFLSWLVVLSLLIVVAALLGATLTGRSDAGVQP